MNQRKFYEERIHTYLGIKQIKNTIIELFLHPVKAILSVLSDFKIGRLRVLILIHMGFYLITPNALSQEHLGDKEKDRQKEIIEKYVNNCAKKFPLDSSAYQTCLDAGIAQDSTIAYLWQQKAMPYFKAMKYEVGMVTWIKPYNTIVENGCLTGLSLNVFLQKPIMKL